MLSGVSMVRQNFPGHNPDVSTKLMEKMDHVFDEQLASPSLAVEFPQCLDGQSLAYTSAFSDNLTVPGANKTSLCTLREKSIGQGSSCYYLNGKFAIDKLGMCLPDNFGYAQDGSTSFVSKRIGGCVEGFKEVDRTIFKVSESDEYRAHASDRSKNDDHRINCVETKSNSSMIVDDKNNISGADAHDRGIKRDTVNRLGLLEGYLTSTEAEIPSHYPENLPSGCAKGLDCRITERLPPVSPQDSLVDNKNSLVDDSMQLIKPPNVVGSLKRQKLDADHGSFLEIKAAEIPYQDLFTDAIKTRVCDHQHIQKQVSEEIAYTDEKSSDDEDVLLIETLTVQRPSNCRRLPSGSRRVTRSLSRVLNS